VLVLHRVVPPLSALRGGPSAAATALWQLARQPRREVRDGLDVTYLPYVSPPRPRFYSTWGSWAAPALAIALARLRRSFDFELIHAHNAVPAADAAIRAGVRVPLVVSVHGGDVLYTAVRDARGHAAVSRGLRGARLVLANSQGIASMCRELGAGDTRVVRLGTELPKSATRSARSGTPTLVSVAHLVARKRHGDVLRAMAVLSSRHATLRYVIVGDGPERLPLEGLARRLGIAERVEFCGQLGPDEAIARARECTLFVMPSTEEAFGVAYVEAMAGGLPAIGCRGEPGPEEIAAAGDGLVLVPPGDIERLSQRIEELLSDPDRLRETGLRARATVAANFTWDSCARQTLAAYRDALR